MHSGLRCSNIGTHRTRKPRYRHSFVCSANLPRTLYPYFLDVMSHTPLGRTRLTRGKRHSECATSRHRNDGPSTPSDYVRIQNQVGPHPTKWDKTGIIIEVHQFDQYIVKVDGSGRVTLRNRKFLRQYLPARERRQPRSITEDMPQPAPSPLLPPAPQPTATPLPEVIPQERDRVVTCHLPHLAQLLLRLNYNHFFLQVASGAPARPG